jgi:outer membrane protein TolC
MRRRNHRLSTVLRAAPVLVCVLARGGPSSAGEVPHRYTLDELIKRALATSPEVRASRTAVVVAQARKTQADGARFLQIDLDGGLGPSPRARGTVENGSPDSKNHPVINGVFGRGELKAVQPLYTFGLIAGLREAADQGVRVEEERVRETAAEMTMRIKRLYYGKLLTADLLALIDEVTDDLDTAIDNIQKRLAKGAPNADETDVYKLQAYRAIAREAQKTVSKDADLATMALRTFADLPAGDTVELDAKGLPIPERDPGVESDNIRTALELRPEIRQARAGVRATAALEHAERSLFFPQLGLVVEGYYAKATNRDFQTNPFIFDPLNDRLVVGVLGVKYHLDFGITIGRIRQAAAEHRLIEDKLAFAEQGIPLQVRLALREVAEVRETVHVTDEGSHSARQWVVAAKASYDFGVGDARDLAQAVELYARLRSDHLLAIHRFNLALAELDRVTGRGPPPPESH